MKRRVFLATASTGAAAAIAGCSGNIGLGDNEREQAKTHYTTAQENLAANDKQIESVASKESLPTEWSPEKLRQRLTAANNALDSAEEYAPDDLLPEINNLRAVADFQSAVITYTDTLVDVKNCWSTTKEYINNQDWETAYTHLDDCRASLGNLDDQYTSVTTKFEEIDAERLAKTTNLDYSNLSAKVPLEKDGLEARLDILDGLDLFLQGMSHVRTGGTHLSNKEFTTAQDQFSTAATKFTASTETFNEYIGDSKTPENLSTTLSTLQCTASNAATGSEYLARGAEASSNENYDTAKEHFNTGRDYFTKPCS